MKRLAGTAALVAVIIAAVFAAVLSPSIQAQPSPSYYANSTPIAAAIAASGAASAVKGLNVPKTYQVTASTGSGTGTAVVSVQGSVTNSGPWDTVGTVTLTLSTTPSSGSFTSLDRYPWVRANASTLTGTTATYSLTMGY